MIISNAAVNQNVDLSSFAEGIYVLRGVNGNTVITKRVVLSR